MDELLPLIERAKSGDLAAFGEIVSAYQDMACACAHAVLGDVHLAQDAAQDAFVEAYRCLAKLHEPAAFPGWLRRIVRRRCGRLIRRKHLPTAPLGEALTVPCPDSDPATLAEEREMRDGVLMAIRSLPDRQRMVTSLYYMQGHSQRDIAAFLGLPVTTINSRLHASREQIKATLCVPSPTSAQSEWSPIMSRRSAPNGWLVAGSAPADYEIGVDHAICHSGRASGSIKSKGADREVFGTLMQMFGAERHLGKRLRMSAYVKSQDVEGWAGLWMRVDSTVPGKHLSFDNMQGRPIKGTTDWAKHQVVLDVPSDSERIAFGVLLHGAGHVWFDDFEFQAVDSDVPTTGSRPYDYPDEPQNLDFES